MLNRKEYSYRGSVAIPDRDGKQKISSYLWTGQTIASSEREAISNLKHQYRKECKMNTRMPLIMPIRNLREGDK